MKRKQVYSLIDEERDYQDRKWGGSEHDAQHSIADWIIFMEIFLNKAKQSLRVGGSDVLVDITKVTALGVACLESRVAVGSHGLEVDKEIT